MEDERLQDDSARSTSTSAARMEGTKVGEKKVLEDLVRGAEGLLVC